MTLAKVLCGECGGPILVSDRRCPHCGVAVEMPPESAAVVCPQCGHRQEGEREACSACGASLTARVEARPSRPRETQSTRPKAAGVPTAAARGRSARLWQVISIVAVGVLLVVLAWSELSRDSSVPSGQTAAPMPSQQTVDIAPLERAVAENPDDVHARLALANALQDNGTYARAIDLYRDYLAKHPEDPDARVDLGICYFELARTDSVHGGTFYDLAISEMTSAFDRVPTHQPAAFNLGIVYLTGGNLEQSNRWFKRAAALDSSSSLGRRAMQMLEQHRMSTE